MIGSPSLIAVVDFDINAWATVDKPTPKPVPIPMRTLRFKNFLLDNWLFISFIKGLYYLLQLVNS
jgi:hypothetical protein